jgi:hypothetical protein
MEAVPTIKKCGVLYHTCSMFVINCHRQNTSPLSHPEYSYPSTIPVRFPFRFFLPFLTSFLTFLPNRYYNIGAHIFILVNSYCVPYLFVMWNKLYLIRSLFDYFSFIFRHKIWTPSFWIVVIWQKHVWIPYLVYSRGGRTHVYSVNPKPVAAPRFTASVHCTVGAET